MRRRSVENEAEDSLCPVAGDGDGDVGEGDDGVPAAENPLQISLLQWSWGYALKPKACQTDE